MTEIPISHRAGQTCRTKYLKEIFWGNIWRKYAGEGAFSEDEKSAGKYVGDFRGGIQVGGILQHTCLVFVLSTFCTNCVPCSSKDSPELTLV